MIKARQVAAAAAEKALQVELDQAMTASEAEAASDEAAARVMDAGWWHSETDLFIL